MISTLKEAMNSIKTLQKTPRAAGESVADALLGKYAGVLPRGKGSTEFIRELRSSRLDRKR